MKETPLRCLVVEDEALSAEIIRDYITEVPFLTYMDTCTDAIFALEFMRKNELDVLFLDINLPRLKGLDFARTLDHPPQIIFTTAYPQYALDSYELGVTDYLLKPIAFPRFLQAVNRLKRNVSKHEKPVPLRETAAIPDFLFFSVNKQKVKVELSQIRYVESLREYLAIYTMDQKLVIKGSLKDLLARLGNDFIRIHKSYVVAKRFVTAYDARTIKLAAHSLPIGRIYRPEVLRILNEWSGTV